jgi:hypothetical protein
MPSYGAAKSNPEKEMKREVGKFEEGATPHTVLIHSHDDGHTVHAFHGDGSHTMKMHATPEAATEHALSLINPGRAKGTVASPAEGEAGE